METFVFEGVWGWGLEFGSWAPPFQIPGGGPSTICEVGQLAVKTFFDSFCTVLHQPLLVNILFSISLSRTLTDLFPRM